MAQRKKQQTERTDSMHQESRVQERIERFYPDPSVGLSPEQVKQRIQQGLSNVDTGAKTKTEGQIIKSNVFTFFNVLNFILAGCVILVGDYKNILFLGIVFWNILIGSFQEIRSKRIIDKLSLISAPKANLIRSGKQVLVAVNEIVLDDVILLTAGKQIPSDSIVMEGEVEVNESLITGESDPVLKYPGDSLLSSSFVVSGSCTAKVEHVAADNYANKIAGDAGYVKPRNSRIMDSVDLIIKVIGFMLIPIGGLLFYKNHYVLGLSLQDSVVKAVGSMNGMIPEGLVLLTSVVFAVSVIRLAMHKTLVQDLYCVETLARVDVLCLDKTGTITEGTMQVDEMLPFYGYTEDDMKAAMALLVGSLSDDNPTFNAVAAFVGENTERLAADELIPFSSARKWSGAYFADKGAYIMGASEFILGEAFSQIKDVVKPYAEKGQRVLLLAKSDTAFQGKDLPAAIECVGLIVISDKIRREAPRTLRYFADQGVDLKIISGDNAVTVASIAEKAGLEHAQDYIDASVLQTEDEIKQALKKYSVFGRVTPQQKLQFVKALKEDDHTVAMTGDGVNDVLALKEADCSIAMASGSDAARTVSSLVLLDSNFASMPLVVQEGRRSINNLQRSASLFLSKTIFMALIGVLFIFLNYAYPFEPIQLTLYSTLTIGVPSFILALEPNHERLRGDFLKNVIQKAFPTGLTMTVNILMLCALSATFGITNEQLSTVAILVTTITGFMMLFRVCAPFNGLRGIMLILLLTGFISAFTILGDIFGLVPITIPMAMIITVILTLAVALMLSLTHFIDRILVHHKSLSKKTKQRSARKPA